MSYSAGASLLFTLSLLTLLINQTIAYMIYVDAGVENECFHERVPIGTKLGFSFEVVEGGFNDIDVTIKDPADVILHQEDRSTNGKFTIESNLDGPYHFCFSNKRTSFNPKVILFDIDRSEKRKPLANDDRSSSDSTKGDDETTKLTNMVETLMLSTISARHDVRYLTARDKVHKKISEATNKKLVWWSMTEFFLLLFVSLGQVWYLKRFFEIRRKA